MFPKQSDFFFPVVSDVNSKGETFLDQMGRLCRGKERDKAVSGRDTRAVNYVSS